MFASPLGRCAPSGWVCGVRLRCSSVGFCVGVGFCSLIVSVLPVTMCLLPCGYWSPSVILISLGPVCGPFVGSISLSIYINIKNKIPKEDRDDNEDNNNIFSKIITNTQQKWNYKIMINIKTSVSRIASSFTLPSVLFVSCFWGGFPLCPAVRSPGGGALRVVCGAFFFCPSPPRSGGLPSLASPCVVGGSRRLSPPPRLGVSIRPSFSLCL